MTRNEWFSRLRDKPIAVRMAAHAVGLDNRKPYRRHERYFYKPYRNYFALGAKCNGVALWIGLEREGYAERQEGKWTFWLTRKGLDWLGKELGVTIYDEE